MSHSPRTSRRPLSRHASEESVSQKQRLDRSPHPYRRRSNELEDRFYNNGENPPSADGNIAPQPQCIEGFPGRKFSSSISDSGTEADDERPMFLQTLPPSQLRPRKGWRNPDARRGSGCPSPLLTPSLWDGSSPSLSRRGSERSIRSIPASPLIREQQLEQLSAKHLQKRRAELNRRICEMISLGLMGVISAYGSAMTTKKEVLLHFGFVAALYSMVPVRMWLNAITAKTRHPGSSTPRLRYSASWDPAPFLYPIALPIFVAMSVPLPQNHFVTSNFVLSLCTLPTLIIPYYDFNIHWILSISPFIYSAVLAPPAGRQGHRSGLLHDQQDLMTFYLPLHLFLRHALSYLTTTSLLPAELDLLSVGLINLLLFSISPQAIILKALLWIGGIALLVFCRHVLNWSVGLARVPSWRFRNPGRGVFEGSPLLCALDDWAGGFLSRRAAARQGLDSSDSEQEAPRPRRSRSNDRTIALTRSATNKDLLMTPLHRQRSFFETFEDGKPLPLQRRHTLSAFDLIPARLDLAKLQAQGRLHLKALSKKSFLSLTRAQAVILKWIYALYTYAMIIIITALPLRSYISHRALHGNEPVGWALGYLFGNLQNFRMQTVLWSLERWICLPPNLDVSSFSLPLAEQYRQITFGPANTRLLISAHCLTCIITGLLIVFRLSSIAEVDTRRKVFHGMMVAMFLPTIFVDPAFVSLALSLILAIFLLLDLFRASQLPPISKPLTYFLAPYVDGRDHRGPVVISPIFLLIGCAIPLWLSLAATGRAGASPFKGWELPTRDLSMVSGVVCVGMGDAAASLMGRRYGRQRWMWSGGKSLEGSLAFAVAVVVGLTAARMWLLQGEWAGDSGDSWGLFGGKAMVAATGASFTEAVLTGGNDNVIVPVVLWLLVKGLEM